MPSLEKVEMTIRKDYYCSYKVDVMLVDSCRCLCLLVGLGSLELLICVLENGGDMHSQTLCEKFYPFDVAVMNRQYAIAECLLERGFHSAIINESVFHKCINFGELFGANLFIRAGTH